jgi:hypothetical protein
MGLSPAASKTAFEIAPLVHRREYNEAACAVADLLKIPRRQLGLNTKGSTVKAQTLLKTFLTGLLDNGGFPEAAAILWTPNMFTFEPSSVRAVWQLFDTSDRGLIMGAAKMGKSFSMGVRFLLEWIRDPKYTTIRVLGPSEDHLEQNLFSHLVGLHKNSSLELPGEIGELFIGIDRRDQMSSIKGVVIPKGNTKKAGRLQGGHRRPREQVHPLFGPLSRMFIFLDEIENIPNGVWLDIDNVLSEIEKGSQGFKIFGAYNPTNATDEVGKRAEPPFGWAALDEDVHFRWRSVRGWEVLRLDGEQCENVLQGRIIFPGLQTRDGLEAIAQGAGGRNAPGYRTMGRGMYPSMGMEAVVIPPGMLPKMRGEFIWYDPPTPCVGVDLALEGGDEAVYTLGKWGKASGMKLPPNLEFPQGQTVMFKDPRGQLVPRWGLEVTQQFVLPKGETITMKNNVLDMNRKAGVSPEFFACDRTGHGAGVADILRYEWGTQIHDVNYSESAGEEKLMQEDTKTCKELYERMFSVLWFATRQWGEFGYLLLNPALDLSKLTQQLTQRRFRTQVGKAKVESKADYKSRGFTSPNEADSLTLCVHAARKGSGLVFSRRGDFIDMPGADGWSDDWPGSYPDSARVDPSSQSDFLDERDGQFNRNLETIL